MPQKNLREPVHAGPVHEPAIGVSTRQLSLLSEIHSAIEEIRQLLTGRRKSHYTVEEVAELTGRAPYTVRTWIKEGLLRAIRVDGTGPRGRLLIAREELDRLIAAGRAARVDDIIAG